MSGFAPPMLLALGMRLATRAGQRNVNTVTTNVAGPAVPAVRGGATDAAGVPVRGPLGGQIPRRHRHLLLRTARSTSASPATTTTTPDIDVLSHGIEDGMAQLLKA